MRGALGKCTVGADPGLKGAVSAGRLETAFSGLGDAQSRSGAVGPEYGPGPTRGRRYVVYIKRGTIGWYRSQSARKPARPPVYLCMRVCHTCTGDGDACVANDGDHALVVAGTEGLGHRQPAGRGCDKVSSELVVRPQPRLPPAHKVQSRPRCSCMWVRVCMRGALGKCRSRPRPETQHRTLALWVGGAAVLEKGLLWFTRGRPWRTPQARLFGHRHRGTPPKPQRPGEEGT